MPIKKYLIGMVLGIAIGGLLATLSAQFGSEKSTRTIASEKWSKMPRGHVGKVAAPLYVQIYDTRESRPEEGYYKLIAHISFNQAVGKINYQWSLPTDSRLISGNKEGELQLFHGEDEWEESIEIQLTDLKRDQNVLFDLSYEQNGQPLGSSDIYVFRSQAF